MSAVSPRPVGPSPVSPTSAGSGEGIDPGGGDTATFTVAPASWDSRPVRAALNGTIGSTVAGQFWLLPGDTTEYIWWSQDDGNGRYVGLDPGDWVAALAGVTGIEVQLDAGNLTGAQRAVATRAAMAGSAFDVSGSGASVVVSGNGLNAAGILIGGMHDESVTTRQHGCRLGTPQYSGNPLNGIVGSHLSAPAVDGIPLALGIYLSAHTDQVRLGLFLGGDTDLSTTTTLVCEGVTSGSATGWNWALLTSTEMASITAGSDLWLLAKSNSATTDPGYTGLVASDGVDLTNQNMIIFDDFDPDPDTLFASDSAGVDLSAIAQAGSSPVYLHVALIYRPVDAAGDRVLLRIGTHSDLVFDSGFESDLTALSPGANVGVTLSVPDVQDFEVDAVEVAVGNEHTDQFRLAVYTGGILEDMDGATLVWDAGLTSGDLTEEWVSISAGATSYPITAEATIWWVVRGNGGITIAYADTTDAGFANPSWDPFDLEVTTPGNGHEYEFDEDNPNHSIDPTDPFESPMVGDASDFLPGNYPGCRVILRGPIDTVAS